MTLLNMRIAVRNVRSLNNTLKEEVVGKCHLTLKWGTLKSWDFSGNEEATKLLERYFKIGGSMSAALQKDTPEQKEIICKLIDMVPDKVYLDWDGKYVSKTKAKKYVMNAGVKV